MYGHKRGSVEDLSARRWTATMLGLRSMAGETFTEDDRHAIEDGLAVVATAMHQPVGTRAASRARGAVSDAEYDRGVMQVLVGCMQLWLSGKLDLVEVDPS